MEEEGIEKHSKYQKPFVDWLGLGAICPASRQRFALHMAIRQELFATPARPVNFQMADGPEV